MHLKTERWAQMKNTEHAAGTNFVTVADAFVWKAEEQGL